METEKHVAILVDRVIAHADDPIHAGAFRERLIDFGGMVFNTFHGDEESIIEGVTNRLKRLMDPTFKERGSRY